MEVSESILIDNHPTYYSHLLTKDCESRNLSINKTLLQRNKTYFSPTTNCQPLQARSYPTLNTSKLNIPFEHPQKCQKRKKLRELTSQKPRFTRVSSRIHSPLYSNYHAHFRRRCTRVCRPRTNNTHNKGREYG